MQQLAPSPSQQGCPSHGLVSLLDMLRFHADKFIEAINTLSNAEALISHPGWKKNDGNIELIHGKVAVLSELCGALGLTVSKKKADKIAYFLSTMPRDDIVGFVAWVSSNIRDLKERIEDELENRALYYLSDRVELLNTFEPPFGIVVAEKFPSASYDIEEAGKCLALHRSTACVLHLMRALEHPLKAMAGAVGVEQVQDNWNKILNDIEARIRSKDKDGNRVNDQRWAGRERDRDFFTEAATSFFVIKNAWRNYASHGNKEKYTEEEADAIYGAVKSFFRHLSQRLSEGPDLSEAS